MKTARTLASALAGLGLAGAGWLRADALAEALPVLKANDPDFRALHLHAGDRLDDVVARSGGRLVLAAPHPAASPPPAILIAQLPENVLYLRLASFQPAAGWPAFAAQVEKSTAAGAGGFVLDLRSNGAPDDFDGAARVAGFFTPPGAPLFTVKDAQGHDRAYASPAATGSAAALPVAPKPVIVLIDRETEGAAEALAASLKANGALVIGHRTAGRAALFAQRTLSSGQTLRYVAGDVFLPDGRLLWNRPVLPDIAPAVNERDQESALAMIAQNRVADVIQEAAERHRMSEAALVHDEDPEIDAMLLSSAPKSPAAARVSQDVVLVAALDSLKAIRLSQGGPAEPAAANPAPASTSTTAAER